MTTSSIGNLLTQGGVPATGPQQALGNWNMGEGIVNTGTGYEAGPALSTNATMSNVGNILSGAQTTAGESLANTQAQAGAINQGFGNVASGLGNILGKAGRSG